MRFRHVQHAHARTQGGENIQQGCACGIQQRIFDDQVGVWKKGRCAEKESRRGDVTGNGCRNGAERLPAANLNLRAPPFHLGAEGAQSQLAMIAGSRRLFYPRLALGQQAGEQHTRFHLRTGDRHLVLDGAQRAARASDAQRRQTSRLRIYAGSHLLQRRDDALHRAPGERLVASHLAGELLAGKNTRQHAHGGTGVATIQRLGRNLEALTAPGDFQHAVSLRGATA